MNPAEIMAHQPMAPAVLRFPVGRNGCAIGPHAEEIVSSVCRRLDISVERLMSRSQRRAVAHCRQEAMYALYATGRYSLPVIGAYFGRDHTTVLHGIRAHEARGGGA